MEARSSISEHDSAAIMRGVLDMLVECHRHHICYGDVKPANFLITAVTASLGWPLGDRHLPHSFTQHTAVKAVDFGCSHRFTKCTPLRQERGTPLYMAPEMATQRYGLLVDVWAAGVMVSTLAMVCAGYHIHCRFWLAACMYSFPCILTDLQCFKELRAALFACMNALRTSYYTPHGMSGCVLQLYQLLTGKLPFWQNKSIKDVKGLQLFEILSAVRTHQVREARIGASLSNGVRVACSTLGQSIDMPLHRSLLAC